MKTLICPICKGDKINLYLGGYAGMLYRCTSCGYVGPVVLKVDDLDALKELEKLPKETYLTEKKHIDEDEKIPDKKTRRGGIK
ncbi:MAG: hypothetical protein RMJ14_01670 [Nitrososphaerota archaeon]|nr:hypothetical protein [Nitrososphaerota archaeon]